MARRHLDHRQGPHRAHRREPRARRRRRARRAHPREPAEDGLTDNAYSDDVAPGGSPFRPLYDDKIKFNGQPIALVVAEDWETARFAATLVRVEYEAEDHATDLHARLDKAYCGRQAGEAARRRGEGLCRRRGAPRGRIFHPGRASQPDGAVRRDRRSGTATASSRSTTRPRACRTCSATSAACSA